MNATVRESAITLSIANKVIGAEELQIVDARELHKNLWIWKHFSTWIKEMFQKYWFEEKNDYFPFLGNGDWVWKWSTRKDYLLTLDTAKEIAMVQNNEKWRQLRRYLIEIEKKFKTQTPQLKALDWFTTDDTEKIFKYLSKKVTDQAETIGELLQFKHSVENQEVKIDTTIGNDFMNVVLKAGKVFEENQNTIKSLTTQLEQVKKLPAPEQATRGHYSIEEVGKILWIGEKTFFAQLRADKILTHDNKPHQDMISRGYMRLFHKSYKKWNDTVAYTQSYFTPKGADWVRNRYTMVEA